MVPSGLKNLRIDETIYLFIYLFLEDLGEGKSEDTKDIFV